LENTEELRDLYSAETQLGGLCKKWPIFIETIWAGQLTVRRLPDSLDPYGRFARTLKKTATSGDIALISGIGP
jgi:hypothetical protein